MATQQRQFIKYTFLKVKAAWRGLPDEEREAGKAEVAGVIEDLAGRMIVRTYSTIGTRGDCDVFLWTVSDRLDDFQAMMSRLFGTRMGPYLDVAYSYLAMTKRSTYIDNHQHEGQEGSRLKVRPVGSTYLFVYPFVKSRPWYLLSKDERQTMMDTHIAIGHKYPSVRIHTSYSFGLDDQEFVVAFETESPADFLDLVMELRETRSSEYTLRDTPIFTCVAATPREALDLLASRQADGAEDRRPAGIGAATGNGRAAADAKPDPTRSGGER